MDPRVRTPPAALAQQFAAASRVAAAMKLDYGVWQAVRAQGSVTDSLESAARTVSGQLAGLLDLIDGVDAAPTTQAARAVTTLEGKLAKLLARWRAIRRR
jgi:hypothetical protein